MTGSTGEPARAELRELVEQARQALVLAPVHIEVADLDDLDPDLDLVPVRQVAAVLEDVEQLCQGVTGTGGWVAEVPASLLDESGDEQEADWEDMSIDQLRRVAAYAVVAMTLLRQRQAEHMLNAVAALFAAERRELRVGADLADVT